MKERTKKGIRIAVIAVLLAVLTIVCVRYVVPLSRLLVTQEGRAYICERVESFGILAPLVFILLMALQIVIAFIPGGPLELIGGMLFGSLLGLLVTTLGALLGTLTVYALVRRFGKPLVDFFVSEEKAAKFKILQDEDRLTFWVFLLFLIPGIPKDLLTYLVPLTKMRGRDFILLSTLARFPSLAASVLVGDSLSDGRYWLSVTICAVAAIAAFIGYWLKKRFIKEKSE